MESLDDAYMHADIAIIGGGSVGVSFLCQLIKCLVPQTAHPGPFPQILLFEPACSPGSGEAYGGDLNTNLLNIPVRGMTAFADDKAHFQRWLQAQPPSLLSRFGVHQFDDDSFLPRPLFGYYMERVYENSLQEAASKGISLHHVRNRVDALEKDVNGRWAISCPGGRYAAKRVVLCNGNLPSAAFPELEEHAGYFNDPYPVSQLTRRIEPDASVAILGSSLSAIDAIVALKEAGHQGLIQCFSRNGRLPSVRSPLNRRHLEPKLTAQGIRQAAQAHGGRLTLKDFFSLLAAQMNALGGEMDVADMLGPQLPAREALSREIAAAQAHERLWQVVSAASNEVIDFAWHLLPQAERREYHERWRSLWMARRATFPMRNARNLQRYFADGALEVLGGYQSCAYNAETRAFTLRAHSAQTAQTRAYRADYVINATSFCLDATRAKDSLIQQLLRHGYAAADPFGGLRLDYETGCLLDAQGATQPTISLLGSLAVGTYFWTISMDVNARLAQGQAQRIAGELAQELQAIR